MYRYEFLIDGEWKYVPPDGTEIEGWEPLEDALCGFVLRKMERAPELGAVGLRVVDEDGNVEREEYLWGGGERCG